MTSSESTQSAPVKSIDYSDQTLRRAKRALACSPFRLKLLQGMRSHSVALREITYDAGMVKGYTRRPLSELGAENELTWLITVGLLRREVDGQGLTDSFRLTPLGRCLLDQWDQQSRPDLPVRFQDQLYNALSRWLRLPDWL